jgi:WD40 repeat protein
MMVGAIYSPDGRTVAVNVERENQPVEVRILDAMTGRQLRALRGHADSALRLAFSPDGARLAGSCQDQTARIWDVATGREVFVLRGHTGNVVGVAFSPDGARLATGSFDRTVRVWDMLEGKELLVLRGHASAAFVTAFSPDGRRILTHSFDRTIRAWDAHSGHELGYLIPGPDGIYLPQLACSRDGRQLAVSVGETIQLWDAAVLTPPSGAQPVPGPQADADTPAAGPDRHTRQ